MFNIKLICKYDPVKSMASEATAAGKIYQYYQMIMFR